jgi:hypothetical protein
MGTRPEPALQSQVELVGGRHVGQDRRRVSLAIGGPFRFFVGTESGDTFRFDWIASRWADPATLPSDWIGGRWADPVLLAQPRAGTISSIRCDPDPNRPDHLWVTYSDVNGPTIYRSDDGGAHWKDYINGLPVVPVNIVEMDPQNTRIVFAGTDVGVWRSENAGDTWDIFSTGLPEAIVGNLLFHPKARVLRAATRSRGVWEVDVDQATPDPHIYLRHSAVDTDRNLSTSGAADPFQPLGIANWWDSPDIQFRSAAPNRLEKQPRMWDLEGLGNVLEVDQPAKKLGLSVRSSFNGDPFLSSRHVQDASCSDP